MRRTRAPGPSTSPSTRAASGRVRRSGTRTSSKQLSAHEYEVSGELTIRGATRPVKLHVRYLGRWETPWWEGNVDKGPKVRAGFVATTTINRHDFGVSWNSPLDRGGVVVGDEIVIVIDAEAIMEEKP